MKILVTGATGFIGGALLKSLVSDTSYQPVAVIRRNCEELEKIVPCLKIPDINSDFNWQEALLGVDVVVHTAARVHVLKETGGDALSEFSKVNVEGTIKIANEAKKAGVKRFVFISSVGVNGVATEAGKKFDADDSPNPSSAYAISKMEAEKALLTIAGENTMEVVIIRPPMVYGNIEKGNFATLVKLVKTRLPLPFAALHNKRSFVSIDNLVDLIKLCLSHKSAANQIFLVSDGNDISTPEFIHHIEKALGKSSCLFPFPASIIHIILMLIGKKGALQSIYGSLQIDISKTTEKLGWLPPVSIENALKKHLGNS